MTGLTFGGFTLEECRQRGFRLYQATAVPEGFTTVLGLSKGQNTLQADRALEPHELATVATLLGSCYAPLPTLTMEQAGELLETEGLPVGIGGRG